MENLKASENRFKNSPKSLFSVRKYVLRKIKVFLQEHRFPPELLHGNFSEELVGTISFPFDEISLSLSRNNDIETKISTENSPWKNLKSNILTCCPLRRTSRNLTKSESLYFFLLVQI